MVSKNNHKQYAAKMEDKTQRFTIKKLTIGVASVSVGAFLLMHNGVVEASAEEAKVSSEEELGDIIEQDQNDFIDEQTDEETNNEVVEVEEENKENVADAEGQDSEAAELNKEETQEENGADSTGVESTEVEVPAEKDAEEGQAESNADEGLESSETESDELDGSTEVATFSALSQADSTALEDDQVLVTQQVQTPVSNITQENLAYENGRLVLHNQEPGTNIAAVLPNGNVLTKQVPYHGRWEPLQNLSRTRIYPGDELEFFTYQGTETSDSVYLTVEGEGESRPADQQNIQYGRQSFGFKPTLNDTRITYHTEPFFYVVMNFQDGTSATQRATYLGQTAFNFEENNYVPGPGHRFFVNVYDRDGNLVDLRDPNLFANPETNQIETRIDGELVSTSNTLTIDPNGGQINDDYRETVVEEGETYRLPYTFQSNLAREGYTLTGYTVEGELRDAQGNVITEIGWFPADYTLGSDVTLRANWEVTSGNFRIELYDDNPGEQTENYTVTLTGEDGQQYELSSNSASQNYRTWEVNGIPNGAYVLSIDGFTILEGQKRGQTDTESSFVVNEDGTATLLLEFVDGNTTSFIRYEVRGEQVVPFQIQAPEVYDVATRKERSVEGMTPEGAESIRVYLPGDTEEYREARILSQRPGGGRSFRLALPEGYNFEAGQEVRVTAVDENGNESEATVKTVIDSDAVTQLTVNPIYPGDETISGTVNPEASVDIRVQGGASRSATVADDGTWQVRLFNDSARLTTGDPVSVHVRVDGNTHRYDNDFFVEEAPFQIQAPEVYDVATRKERSVEGMTPEGAESIRVYLPGDTEEYREARILSQRPGGGRSFRLALPEGYNFEAGQEVRVTAVDENGNESEATVKTVIDSDVVSQLTVNPIYPGDETISGTVNPEASVDIRVQGGASRSATVADDGTWQVRLFNDSARLTTGDPVSVHVRVDGNTHRYDNDFFVEEAPVRTARAYISYRFLDADGNVVGQSSQVSNDAGGVGENFTFSATGIPVPEGYTLAPDQEFGDQLSVEYGNRDNYPTVDVQVVAEEPQVETARAYIGYRFVDEDGNVVGQSSQFSNEAGTVGESFAFPATGIPVPEGYTLAPDQEFGDQLSVEYGNRDNYPTVDVQVVAEEDDAPVTPEEPQPETARAYIAYQFVDLDGNVVGQNSQYSNEEGVIGETFRFPATGIVVPEDYTLVPGQELSDRLEVEYGNRDNYPTVMVFVEPVEDDSTETPVEPDPETPETPEEPEVPGVTEEDLQAILDRINELENRVDELEQENQELRDELDRLRDELDRVREENDSTEDRVNELEDQVDDLEDRVDDLEDRVDDLEDENAGSTPDANEQEQPGEETDDDSLESDTDDTDDSESDAATDAEVDPDSAVESEAKEAGVDKAQVLPNTSVAPGAILLGLTSLLSGLGLGFVDKKRKKD